MELKMCQVIGALFTIIAGTLLHFVYKWTGQNIFVSFFAPVNESTWEHLKLLITPILLFAIGEYILGGKEIINFVPVKLLSIVAGMLTIVVSFYTYVGIVGNHYLWADIATFILGVIVAYGLSYSLLGTSYFTSLSARQYAWIGLVILMGCMILFTWSPPTIGLFKEPSTTALKP
ncbi:hypothetical protein CS063_12555 [Sporanaerobium hydrogeniformans]|uniref:Uncharacterized protein n=1 Tax=Sporanaerobium hydrogeniformans TaxID=3072179 RepID=A0AC61DAD8_9FIRM|nr:DUF6512 family protein [Sporanaerobium hydrogeniformans]PHV69972.1 hypothetical protein CS063_12555 [Sporanaerobium hydrogeniformans]